MKNRLFTFAVMAMLCFSVAMAQKVTIDGITYKVKGDHAEVTGSDKKITEAIIKDVVTIEGKEYSVTEIAGSEVFYSRQNLIKVSIPNSIQVIHQWSFRACSNLIEVIVPDHPITRKGVGNVFFGCYKISVVKCQNGNFPTHILGELPYHCPFRDASNNSTVSVLVNQQSGKNSILAETNHNPNTSLSDIDQNVPESTLENENTFALIIANENYQEETKAVYALNDGETFNLYCKKALGIPEENVHFRKDATLNNIKTELDWMRKIADAYKGTARFMVYYHGHSTQDQTALLPIDGKKAMSDTGYSLQELFQVLGNMSAASISVFLDTNIRNTSLLPQGKTIVFTAATETEEAYPFKEKGHNLFTYYLLKKLQATNGDVSLGELETYLKEQVVRKSIVTQGKSQTPSVNVSAAVGETWKNLKLK